MLQYQKHSKKKYLNLGDIYDEIIIPSSNKSHQGPLENNSPSHNQTIKSLKSQRQMLMNSLQKNIGTIRKKINTSSHQLSKNDLYNNYINEKQKRFYESTLLSARLQNQKRQKTTSTQNARKQYYFEYQNIQSHAPQSQQNRKIGSFSQRRTLQKDHRIKDKKEQQALNSAQMNVIQIQSEQKILNHNFTESILPHYQKKGIQITSKTLIDTSFLSVTQSQKKTQSKYLKSIIQFQQQLEPIARQATAKKIKIFNK